MSELRLDHTTPTDDSLIHQVRFHVVARVIKISCVCRRTTGQHEKAGKLYYSHIGSTKNIKESRELYNNPENHWAPFTEEDFAKW